MEHSMESISEKIRGRVDAKFSVLLANLAEELAYDFMFSLKSFLINDYYSVEDFFGEDRTGYTSDIGFLNYNVEEKYVDVTREFIFDCYIEVLSEIDEQLLLSLLAERGHTVLEAGKMSVIEAVTEHELFEEPFWHHFEIMERVKPLGLKMMVAQGKNGAIKKYQNQLAKKEEKARKIEFEQKKAQELWQRLEKRFRLQKGYPLPKVEMKDYTMFLEFLNYNDISIEERACLAKYMNNKFSNKVCMCLGNNQGNQT